MLDFKCFYLPSNTWNWCSSAIFCCQVQNTLPSLSSVSVACSCVQVFNCWGWLNMGGFLYSCQLCRVKKYVQDITTCVLLCYNWLSPAGEDYGMVTDMHLGPVWNSNRHQCFTLNILNDIQSENTENFIVDVCFCPGETVPPRSSKWHYHDHRLLFVCIALQLWFHSAVVHTSR